MQTVVVTSEGMCSATRLIEMNKFGNDLLQWCIRLGELVGECLSCQRIAVRLKHLPRRKCGRSGGGNDKANFYLDVTYICQMLHMILHSLIVNH